jgi:hypothetical protein
MPKSGSKGKFCSLSCSAANSSIVYREKANHNRKLNEERYLKCPILCKQYKNIIPFSKKKNKFCSSSCSSSFNNTGKVKSIKSRLKISNSVKLYYHTNKKSISKTQQKVKIIHKLKCVSCQNTFDSLTIRKTCSTVCCNQIIRTARIQYLKDNAGTFNWIRKGKLNYVETCFDEWLMSIGYIKNDDYYALNYTLYNDEKNTSYIMDFWFPKLNLNIELDGSHHERVEQIERDTIRDEWMNRVHNIQIIRIKVKEWNNKHKRDNIKQSLLSNVLYSC